MPGAPPPTHLGHYQILREAGRGGMSLVYEAVDNRMGRRVALKVLSGQVYAGSEGQDARVARFKRESRAIARLSHPSIVSIYDIGEEDGQHFLVMEFLEGETLRERTVRGPIPPGEASAILRQIASGLDAVHQAGIVHRDVKPSNVMLLPDGKAKLMDFGVARQREDTLVTQAGAMVGSPVYMSPEQVNGQEHGAASDLWSLGVILYEMLAGRAPFEGETIPNVLYQVAHAEPAPLEGAPPAVRLVLDRALDKNPARRFQSATEMADAFDAALAAPPITPVTPAAQTPHAPRAPRPAARPGWRRFLWAAVLALVVGAAGWFALAPRRIAVTQQPVRVRPAPHAPVRGHAAAAPLSAAARAPRRRRPAPERSAARRVAVSPRRAAAAKQTALVSHAPLPRRSFRKPPRQADAPRVAHVTPPAPLRVRVSVEPSPPAPNAGASQNILGTWHGSNSRNPATLVITRRQGNTFAGTMNVRTHEANVRIAVQGRVSPKTGAMTMRETQVISSTKPRAWDLGQELGRLFSGRRMSGTGTDVKGRTGPWSFSR